MFSVNDDDRCNGCGGKVPKMGTPRYEAARKKKEGCHRRRAKVANTEVDVCGRFNPFISDGETRYDRYIGTKCHDPRHENPCPLPCVACDHECDGPYVRYFDVTHVDTVNLDMTTTRRVSPSLVLPEHEIDDMKQRIDRKIADLREVRAGLDNLTEGPRVHERGKIARDVEWASPETIKSRLGGDG